MFVWFNNRKKMRVVRGGKRIRRRCPECDATTEFVECTFERKLTAFSLVELWGEKGSAFSCTECHEVFEIEDTPEPEVSAHERQAQQRERLRKAEEARAARARAKAQRDAQVDKELEDLKRKLNLS
ncbi:MAG: hypothetical protein B7733_00680 [Myxococcales bacterium FL481]|nr:MAG: hypothetical protein B7733_00680 [Myxococcales bacterium FL481]